MFRKPKKTPKAAFRSRGRKNDDEGGPGGEANGPSVKNFRKRPAEDDDGSSSDEGGRAGERTTSDLLAQIRREKDGEKSKKRRGAANAEDGGGGGEKKMMHEFRSADASERLTAADLATRAAEHHPTDIAPGESSSAADSGKGDATGDGIYRGSAKPRNKFLAGPMKAPTFVRTTCRFDYQPDICKDYKDTGFCGFGDTCIYLHDRGDTLTGWQLEQQWEERKKKEREEKEKEMQRFLERASKGQGGESDDGEEEGTVKADDGLPFACHICRGPFRDPVITSCGHYFCEECIMARVKGDSGDAEASSACPICGKDTHGVFNHPAKLVAKKRRSVGSNGTWEDFADASRHK